MMRLINSLSLKLPPLLWLCIVAGFMYFCTWLSPRFRYYWWLTNYSVFVCVIMATFILVYAVKTFNRAKTSVNPLNPNVAAVLQTNGIYGLSRNPMYCAFALYLFAFAVWLSNWFAYAGLPCFILLMNQLQIKPEERVLGQKFGDAYFMYCQRVRRWF